jgi:hypothetical protein
LLQKSYELNRHRKPFYNLKPKRLRIFFYVRRLVPCRVSAVRERGRREHSLGLTGIQIIDDVGRDCRGKPRDRSQIDSGN